MSNRINSQDKDCRIEIVAACYRGLLFAIAKPVHELQSRPHLVDGTQLDVDKPILKTDVSNSALGEIGINLGGPLWP